MATTQKMQGAALVMQTICIVLILSVFTDVKSNAKSINENRGTIIELAQKQIAIKDSVMTHYKNECHISRKDMQIYYHEMKESEKFLLKE